MDLAAPFHHPVRVSTMGWYQYHIELVQCANAVRSSNTSWYLLEAVSPILPLARRKAFFVWWRGYVRRMLS
jgi:hypothetical protein